MTSNKKIPLYGFNNLTKSLSFSLYRVHYLASKESVKEYNSYINHTYSSQKLTTILTKTCHTIGGNILNLASQDYSPQGASVTLMISEESKPESLVAHLDKSHLCIHTYPEEAPHNNIAIFRADIELSTCGIISPLKVLNDIIEAFSADVIDIDYRIRGMTRDKQGNKHFCDHETTKISEYLSDNILNRFQITDSAFATKNLFHTKLVKHTANLKENIFTRSKITEEKAEPTIKTTGIIEQLAHELYELYIS